MSNLKRIVLDKPLPLVALTGESICIGKGGARIEIDLKDGDRRNHIVTLTEPGAALQILATGNLQGDDTAEISITVVHQAPQTRAETILLTALHDSSKIVVRGLLKIEPKATGCESFFNHHSLVFDNATVSTWPALEIQNNEVRCSHAATVRTITDSDLFYARSRGLSKIEATTMITQAFLTIN